MCARVESTARFFLSTELLVDTDVSSLTRIEGLDFSDGRLVCPKDGNLYAQAIVLGFRFIFEDLEEILEGPL